MKLDLVKLNKADYVTPKKPVLVKIPEAHYLAIEGQGDPNGSNFPGHIQQLYKSAYTLKMASKRAGQDYTVSKLEALWWVDQGDFMATPPDLWRWKLLIRTPDFIKPPGNGSGVHLEGLAEGLCVQMLHVGPYREEKLTLDAMFAFAGAQGYRPHGIHHEIYLSDPRRVEPARLRTILRMPVVAI